MKIDTRCRPIRTALVAAALLGMSTVYAAAGFMVTAAQQAQIKAGMTRAEVRVALGRPAHNYRYRAEPGRTWTYGVVGSEEKVFDVDFAADGKVISTSQRVEQME